MTTPGLFWLPVLLLSTSLQAQEPVGQFGPYHWINKELRLPDGDTLTVFRVKLWQFPSGQSPALQLEYESRISVDDSAGVRRDLLRVWPAFAPYVEAMHLRSAIVTATNITRHGAPPLPWTATFHSYGHILARDPQGAWLFRNEPASDALPPSLGPDVFLIFEASGLRYVPTP